MSTMDRPVLVDLSIDWRVMAFTTAAAAATAMLFGTAPALRAARVPPIDALRAHGRSGGSGRVSVSNGLVIAQIALSLVLVVDAGLFVRTFARLASVPLGFVSCELTFGNDRNTPLLFAMLPVVIDDVNSGKKSTGAPL